MSEEEIFRRIKELWEKYIPAPDFDVEGKVEEKE